MVAEKIDQCMKPHGEEGYKTIENMNENHKDISDYAFSLISVAENDKILMSAAEGESTLRSS